MTMLAADGFEGQDHTTVWSSVTSTWTNTGTGTRLGYGRFIQSAGNSRVIQQSFTASTDVYIHIAVKFTAIGDGFIDIYGDTNVTRHLRIAVAATGAMEIRNGATTTVLATSAATGLVVAGTWVFWVVHARVHDSTGICEVWVNGNTGTPDVSFSGDTKNGGTNTTVDSVRFVTPAAGSPIFALDDFYVNDTGNEGDIRCQTLVPTGAGSSTQLTASTGSNWQTVDEAPPSSSDYSGSATVGHRDTYQMTDLVAGTTEVLGMKDVVYWHKSDAGAASMKRAMKVGSNVYYGSTVSLGTSMAASQAIQTNSPDTATQWGVSEVNAMELGAEVA